ncbi:MAG: roadblock/LC7 domain-containing protein [Cyanobacteria bacterium REEB65]|nr:roadblock/LC7 domain-containing protein [Cyanobacteria bacterium REEB65]
MDADKVTRLMVTAELQAGFDSALNALVTEDGAKGAVLVERSGMLLAAAGQGPALDRSVGALVAGVFKSLSTLSKLLGEGEVTTFEQVGPSSLTVFNMLDTGDALVASFGPAKPQKEVGGALNLAIAKVTPLLRKARANPAASPLTLDAQSIDSILENL